MRFTTAAIFAGVAAASTVYSTDHVTITSCAPEVTDCPGNGGGYPVAPPPEQPTAEAPPPEYPTTEVPPPPKGSTTVPPPEYPTTEVPPPPEHPTESTTCEESTTVPPPEYPTTEVPPPVEATTSCEETTSVPPPEQPPMTPGYPTGPPPDVPGYPTEVPTLSTRFPPGNGTVPTPTNQPPPIATAGAATLKICFAGVVAVVAAFLF